MKCSDLIAKKIETLTDYAFTGQGGFIVHILDSLQRITKVKIVASQNEQGAGLAADAYTRASGKIGVVVATSGPGILNALQGMACSHFDSIPALYISGAPITKALKKNKNIRQVGFQEMDINNIVGPLCKYVTRILDPKDIIYEIDKAIHIAKSGRPGPVLIDLPDDIQRSEIEENHLKKFKTPSQKKNDNVCIKKNQLSKVKKLFANSKRPLFIFGNGIKISGAKSICEKVLKKFKIPYVPTWASIDLFNTDDELNAGGFGMYATRHGNFAVSNADLVIILGSRLNGTLTGTNKIGFAPKAKKIHVDIDKNELNLKDGFRVDLKINGNVKNFLEELIRINLRLKNFSPWQNQIKVWKDKYPIVSEEYKNQTEYVNPYLFFEKLSELTNKDDILMLDTSANLVWAYQAYKINKRQKIFSALNHSPMGYSVPAAIGAAVSTKKNIIAVIGDSGMQMNIQEIENIRHHNLNIKTFIINNNGMGLIKQTIETWLKGNYVGCDPKSGFSLPNFSKVFNSYGIKSFKINNHNEMHEIIDKCLKTKGPTMCEVMVSEKQKVIPKAKSGSPLYDMQPSLPEDEIKSNILK